MKTINKIVIAGIVGTSFMTLYSFLVAKKENEEYLEPVMINKLISHSKNLPTIKNKDVHPAGWLLHYVTGINFVVLYWLIWKKALLKPDFGKIVITGSVSGLAGIAVWKILFTQHNNPPYNYRKGYYGQLFIAHIVFAAFALNTYKVLDEKEKIILL